MATLLFTDQLVKLQKDLESEGRNKMFFEGFKTLKSDEERMSFVLSSDLVQKNIYLPDVTDKKASEIAAKYRTEGNRCFQRKDYKGSLQFYARSVSHAPQYRPAAKDVENELAFAYANRSAALFYLKQWHDCLSDISHALESSYPQKLKYKLYIRKGQCLLNLGRPKEALIAFSVSKESLQDARMEDQKRENLIHDLDKQIQKASEAAKQKVVVDPAVDPFYNVNSDRTVPELDDDCRNSMFPSLRNICRVVYNPSQGRYLVAERDIYPGEIVLVEKPFASVLLPEHMATTCHHCYKPSYSLIPCPHCTSALYCSVDCRSKSWDLYHQWECSILELIQLSGVGQFAHLALRTITTLGCANILKYKDKVARGDYDHMSSPLSRGCNEDGLYLPTDYRTIHCLVTHSEDREVSDLFHRTIMAVYLTKCIEKTNFFDAYQGSCYKSTVQFVGGLLLSHLQSFPCNAHEIANFALDKENFVESTLVETGAGIYSTMSLFNHSCDPTVSRIVYGDVCVIRAIKTIRKGEEITDNYGAIYAVTPREERRQKLKNQYFFYCQCEPCQQNWPMYPDIEKTNPTWRCRTCLKKVSNEGGLLMCASCQIKDTVASRMKKISDSHQRFCTAFEKLMHFDVISSLPDFLEYLKVIEENIILPWQEFNNCQEAVKQCFSLMGNAFVVLP